ncbi:MAG: tandem-95 repeat protein [Polaromonas sp.]|uniref:cadherin-like domain-containing protein n=1 Tax=Polaromonas sp. TaxID=1869339 RepID=UPI0027347E50|nr:cadherin-like domain-containing protein [Polaromonas sp.]MDP3799735.1 tandem-95 repeat protein [Polaromonas sp.]
MTKEQLAGSVYFVVGRGTEGGNASYRISVAGISESSWQGSVRPDFHNVAVNSGYTFGAMQLDLGARGLLKVGSTTSIAKVSEQNYVDAIIEQSKAYATKNGSPFPEDISNLRAALLTHGNGGVLPNGSVRSKIEFIDTETRDAINAWASSSEGRNWIHQNVDMPIVRDAASKAYDVVQKYGGSWTDDAKNIAALELAKVYNQTGNLRGAIAALEALPSSTFDDLKAAVAGNRDATKALEIGHSFAKANDSDLGTWLESAQRKVLDPHFDPAKFDHDADLKLALQLTKTKAADVTINDGQLSIKVGSQTYRYIMSDDESTVTLDIIRGAGTTKEAIIGGACFDSQAVLNDSARVVSTLMPGNGHWEEQTLYTDLGVPLTTQTVWVLGPAVTGASPSGLSSSGTAPPTNHTTTGAIYLSRDGASATLPDGQVINTGVGGRLELSSDGNLSATRPVPGYSPDEAVYSVTLYSKGGQVIASTQVQVVADPAHPNDPAYSTTVVQGQARDITQTQPDGSSTVVKTVFQTGIGWVEQGTGEIVQSMDQWRQERSAQVAVPTSDDDFYKALLEAFQNPQMPSGQGEQYAGAALETAGDAGGGTSAEPNDYSYTNYLNAAGASLNASQQTGLATALDSLHLGGEGALSFITLPGGGTLIQNVDGEIVGEISQSANGYTRLSSVRINVDGSAEPYTAYVAPSGQTLSQENYEQAQAEAQAGQAASAVGLMNSIIGLQHWDSMSDLQRTVAVASIYNAVDKIAGNALPGDLGTAASVLGLLNALDQGNAGGALYSGLSLVENLTYDAATKMGLVSDTFGGNFLPALGFVLALDSGDPVSIASSGLSLMSSLGMIGPWGAAAAVVITLLGSLFGDEPDIPMREGLAHAEWDGAGNTHVITDQDAEGGGATATGWMQSLVDGLQTQLAGMRDEAGNSYALIPNLLPAIGYQYDPDGFNLANGAKGFVYLKWTDESGQSQTRYYDGAGSRGDGTGETLAGDFIRHAQGAIAPAWQVQTVLAHWQQGQGIQQPDAQASLPQELADGMHQTLQALTLALPVEPALQDALIDIDGDGYLERSQWLAANQSALAIDANGDGIIGTGELLNLGSSTALNSLNWLDTNNDKLLDARDPAFAALRLWTDLNTDASSSNGSGRNAAEVQTLAQAGITAIDFGSNPPAIVKADGSRTPLTAQTLTGDILGVAYKAVTGGVLQLDEKTHVPAIATLHAVNTRQFDGQAAHISGGGAATTTASAAATSTVDAGDSRLATTSARTIATQSTQSSTVLGAGDARMQGGATGRTINGQVAGQTQGTAQVRSNAAVDGLAFIPLGAASLGGEVRLATEAMVRSANIGLLDTASVAMPLTAIALGAVAAQWPTLANTSASSTTAAVQPEPAVASDINWQTWDGTRFSVAASELLAPYSTGFTPALSVAASAAVPAADDSAATDPVAGNFDASNQLLAQEEQPETAINSVVMETPSSALPYDYATQGISATDMLSTDSATLVDFPRVQGELGSSSEDTGLRFPESLLLANDSTLNAPARPGEPGLRITSVFAPVHGSVSLQANAQGALEVVFLPEANYHGPASFSYTVTDQYGLSGSASVSLQLAAVNDAPLTQDEAASGDEDHTLLFTASSLLANDSDADTAVDGDVLRITRVGLAEHGQVFLQPDSTVRFVPDANYNGPARFSYWVGDRSPASIAAGDGYETQASVRLTVLPVNDLPVVTGEVLASDEDIVLNINPALLLANDTDADTASTNAEPAQVLVITAVGNAQHGSIVLLPDGTLRFTPERDYFGAAGFSYTVDDGRGGQVAGQVVVNLAPVNDAPEVLGETVSFNEDEVQTLDQASLLANDSDVDNPPTDLRIVAVDNATHGAVSLNPDGSIRFVPDADYFGPAQFTYTVADGIGGFTVGLASLDIAPVNDAPRLLGEAAALDEDIQARFTASALLANDADVDNPHGDLTISEAGNASHGKVQVVSGEIVFTPDLNFNGSASFTYTVSDGVGGESQATVNLSFNPVNDAPVANSELVWGKRDVSYTLTQAALLANDTDVESPQALRITAISNVRHGAATLDADGNVRFTPAAGYAGRGSFDYVVQDPQGAESTATAQIDFSHVNVNPTATDDGFIGYEDIAFSIAQDQLLVNDSDADNLAADLRVTAVAGAQHGTVSLQADGTVRFVPDADFYGTASFTYQVSDGDGGQTWAMAQLNVQSVNDAPIIEDIWYDRPLYGYQQIFYPGSGRDGDMGSTVDVAIHEEAQARVLAATGELYDRTLRMANFDQEGYVAYVYDYAVVTPTYYRNGAMRPLSMDPLDATFYSPNNPFKLQDPGDTTIWPVDDPYRRAGGVVAYDPDGDSSGITFDMAEGPQHGHAWVNQYTDLSAPREIDHTQAPAYAVAQTGAWQYYSQRGDVYGGADPFSITVTDSGGASTNVAINTVHVGSSASSGGGKPVTLDLTGNGLHYVGLDDSKAYFDVNHDGWREHLAWVSADDALLARDIGGDRVINRFDEISFVSYLAGARTDLEGLAAFDSNGNGLLDRLDARWQEFGAWEDANGDGVSASGEFHTLDEIGITQIGLVSDHQVRQVDGVTELGQSRFTWADGRTGAVGDVAFPIDETARLPSASTVVAAAPLTPEHLALLMVQMINTVTATYDTAPLASIDIQDGQDPDQTLAAMQAQWTQAAQSQAVQLNGASA